MGISANYISLKKNLGPNITLIAVSKTKPEEDILEVYDLGQKDFGENRASELNRKYNNLPKDIRWHMIGHLQRNKVAEILQTTYLIHSVDSIRLANKINAEAKSINKVQKVLLQPKIAEEESKYGFELNELSELLKNDSFKEYANLNIIGIMGMATFTDDKDQITREFSKLQNFYNSYKEKNNWTVLSMGMSGDYSIAVANGSNMVRVGSAIFGTR